VRCLICVSFYRVPTMRKIKRKFTDELKITMHVSEMIVTSGEPNACIHTHTYSFIDSSSAQVGLNVEFVMK
jgi:hypothetical protein